MFKFARFLLLGCLLCISASLQASIVYLADNVTQIGGTANQPFTDTNLSNKFTGGNTIVSGTTTVEDAQTYTILPQDGPGSPRNGRFQLSNFGAVNYLYTTPRDLNGLLFWNYNEFFSPLTYNERGATRADITVTYNGGLTTVFNDVNLSLTPDNDTTTVTSMAQNIDFGLLYTGVTQITFSDLQGTSAFLGWQEVAAYNSVAAVPEPSSVALVGLGLVGMVAFARRRNKYAE